MHHLYAQCFHPSTLLERVRDVRFYRNPRTLFKGFRVPDWATAQNRYGWENDTYSRNAWEQAQHEFFSEATPYPFAGERQEPNPLQWFRIEQLGKGNASRLFYNEVPNPWWYKNHGHFQADKIDENLYSFTTADQSQSIDFGFDTTTEEGRKGFEEVLNVITSSAPELFATTKILFPHQITKPLPNEAHFQRSWTHYRIFKLQQHLQFAVSQGKLSQEDADTVTKLISGRNGYNNINNVILHQHGMVPSNNTIETINRGFEAIGFDPSGSKLTAEHFESQFWNQFDHAFELTELEMRETTPLINSTNRESALRQAIAGG